MLSTLSIIESNIIDVNTHFPMIKCQYPQSYYSYELLYAPCWDNNHHGCLLTDLVDHSISAKSLDRLIGTLRENIMIREI